MLEGAPDFMALKYSYSRRDRPKKASCLLISTILVSLTSQTKGINLTQNQLMQLSLYLAISLIFSPSCLSVFLASFSLFLKVFSSPSFIGDSGRLSAYSPKLNSGPIRKKSKERLSERLTRKVFCQRDSAW